MNKRLFRTSILAAAVAAVGFGAGPASAINLRDLGEQARRILGGGAANVDTYSLAETILKRELPLHVGPADRYEVRLARDGNNLTQGLFRRVDVTGINVRTDDGLVIPKMEFSLEDVRLGLTGGGLQNFARGDFTAGLGAAAINSFVKHRAGTGVKDISVALRNGELHVKGTPQVMGFGVPTEVAGKPMMRGVEAIDFKASRLAVFGIGLPGFAVGMLENEVNPVVDLSGLKLPVRINNVRIEGDRLLASGALSFGKR